MRVFMAIGNMIKGATNALTDEYVTKDLCELRHDYIKDKLDKIDIAVNGAKDSEDLRSYLKRIEGKVDGLKE